VSDAEGSFVVASELGLHARPAGEFVKLASRYDGEVEVSRGGEWMNGKSVLSILSLAASQGTSLRIRVRGEGGEKLLAALGELVERPHEPS